MSKHEHYDAWFADRRDVEPSPEFADRVMTQLEGESGGTASHRSRITDATWFHVAACVAASVIFVLRLGCAYSLFIVF